MLITFQLLFVCDLIEVNVTCAGSEVCLQGAFKEFMLQCWIFFYDIELLYVIPWNIDNCLIFLLAQALQLLLESLSLLKSGEAESNGGDK